MRLSEVLVYGDSEKWGIIRIRHHLQGLTENSFYMTRFTFSCKLRSNVNVICFLRAQEHSKGLTPAFS